MPAAAAWDGYTGPTTLSALARLLADTFKRCDCAVRAEPAIWKILKLDMKTRYYCCNAAIKPFKRWEARLIVL